MKNKVLALVVAGLSIVGFGVGLSREELKTETEVAADTKQTPTKVIVGQIVNLAPRLAKTDPWTFTLQFFDRTTGHDSTITLTTAQKVEMRDVYLLELTSENQIRRLEKCDWQRLKSVKDAANDTTWWLYQDQNNATHIARVLAKPHKHR